jgi:hypothetical protein
MKKCPCGRLLTPLYRPRITDDEGTTGIGSRWELMVDEFLLEDLLWR